MTCHSTVWDGALKAKEKSCTSRGNGLSDVEIHSHGSNRAVSGPSLSGDRLSMLWRCGWRARALFPTTSTAISLPFHSTSHPLWSTQCKQIHGSEPPRESYPDLCSLMLTHLHGHPSHRNMQSFRDCEHRRTLASLH